jgi:hypothetical protein
VSKSAEPGRPYWVRISDGHRQWEAPSTVPWKQIGIALLIVIACVACYGGDPNLAADEATDRLLEGQAQHRHVEHHQPEHTHERQRPEEQRQAGAMMPCLLLLALGLAGYFVLFPRVMAAARRREAAKREEAARRRQAEEDKADEAAWRQRGGGIFKAIGSTPTDLTGISGLCEALKSSSILILNLADCGISVHGISTLAKFIPEMAAIISLNVMKNPIGDDGLAALMTAVKGTSIKSIAGIVEGQTSINWSGQKLEPFDMKILAADIKFTPFSAVIRGVNLSTNKCFGSKNSHPGQPRNEIIHDTDKDQTGWDAICGAFKGTAIETLVLSDIGAGPVALSTLADAISDMAALSTVNLCDNANISVADIEAVKIAAPNVSIEH